MEIVWKQGAKSDLGDIYTFMKGALGDERALKISKKLVKDIDLLKTSPRMGMKLNKNPLARQLILGKYRVIYHYDNNEKIYILAVFNIAFQGYENKLNNIDIP